MSKADTWMPLLIDRYIGDTMHLSTLEHGAYLLLLIHYWRVGPLPDDDKYLSNVTKLDRKVWREEVGPAVRAFFKKGPDGMLHQKRADDERRKANSISEKRRIAGSTKKQTYPIQPINPGSNEQQVIEQTEPQLQDHLDKQMPEQLPPLLRPHARDARTVAPPSTPSSDEEGSVASLRPDAAKLNGVHPTTDLLGPIPIVPDARKALYDEGLPLLRGMLGCSRQGAAAFLGKILRDLGDDCPSALAIIRECRDMNPADPKSFLAAQALAHSPDKAASKASNGHAPNDWPRVGDPLERWKPWAESWDFDKRTGESRPTFRGYYIDGVAREVGEAAAIDAAHWRPDWSPLLAWLKDGIKQTTIVTAIRAVAARPQYRAPNSLAYFDRPVREQPQNSWDP